MFARFFTIIAIQFIEHSRILTAYKQVNDVLLYFNIKHIIRSQRSNIHVYCIRNLILYVYYNSRVCYSYIIIYSFKIFLFPARGRCQLWYNTNTQRVPDLQEFIRPIISPATVVIPKLCGGLCLAECVCRIQP